MAGYIIFAGDGNNAPAVTVNFAVKRQATISVCRTPTRTEEKMAIILYDLAGAEEDRRFSPFCWRIRMALAHKGLEVETIPWRFTEKDKLPQPNAGRVPVIVDDGRVIHDSSAIAGYLELHYPDRSSLFGGETGRALTTFVQNWTETVVQPGWSGLSCSTSAGTRLARIATISGGRARNGLAARSRKWSRTARRGCPPFARA